MIKYKKFVYIAIVTYLTQIHGEKLCKFYYIYIIFVEDLLVTLSFYFVVVIPSRANATSTHNLITLNDVELEVPDSSLLLLDRLNLRKSTTVSYMGRARPKQTVASTTAVAPVTNSSSSSSSDEESRPCTCTLGVCKCCTGLIMDLFNQKACMRVTYHPGDFAFDVAMSWNDRILYENSLTGIC